MKSYIVYAIREGYEIKTWVKADETLSTEDIIQIGQDQFDELGVNLLETDCFEVEEY